MPSFGLYGNSPNGAVIASPSTETVGLYGQSAVGALPAAQGTQTVGLYGQTINYGTTAFEWFIFQVAATAPATPTGGSWNFQSGTGTPPAGWTQQPPTTIPTNPVWVSIAFVDETSTNPLVWTQPGIFGVPGSGVNITSPNLTITVGGSLLAPTLDLAQQAATNGQVLAWNGTKFAPTTLPNEKTTTVSNADGTVTVTPNVVGDNTDYDVKLAQQGATLGQVLSWNGTKFVPSTIGPGGAQYLYQLLDVNLQNEQGTVPSYSTISLTGWTMIGKQTTGIIIQVAQNGTPPGSVFYQNNVPVHIAPTTSGNGFLANQVTNYNANFWAITFTTAIDPTLWPALNASINSVQLVTQVSALNDGSVLAWDTSQTPAKWTDKPVMRLTGNAVYKPDLVQTTASATRIPVNFYTDDPAGNQIGAYVDPTLVTGSITVQDEGVVVNSNTKTLNFTGAGVTAVDSHTADTAVNVNIPGLTVIDDASTSFTPYQIGIASPAANEFVPALGEAAGGGIDNPFPFQAPSNIAELLFPGDRIEIRNAAGTAIYLGDGWIGDPPVQNAGARGLTVSSFAFDRFGFLQLTYTYDGSASLNSAAWPAPVQGLSVWKVAGKKPGASFAGVTTLELAADFTATQNGTGTVLVTPNSEEFKSRQYNNDKSILIQGPNATLTFNDAARTVTIGAQGGQIAGTATARNNGQFDVTAISENTVSGGQFSELQIGTLTAYSDTSNVIATASGITPYAATSGYKFTLPAGSRSPLTVEWNAPKPIRIYRNIAAGGSLTSNAPCFWIGAQAQTAVSGMRSIGTPIFGAKDKDVVNFSDWATQTTSMGGWPQFVDQTGNRISQSYTRAVIDKTSQYVLGVSPAGLYGGRDGNTNFKNSAGGGTSIFLSGNQRWQLIVTGNYSSISYPRQIRIQNLGYYQGTSSARFDAIGILESVSTYDSTNNQTTLNITASSFYVEYVYPNSGPSVSIGDQVSTGAPALTWTSSATANIPASAWWVFDTTTTGGYTFTPGSGAGALMYIEIPANTFTRSPFDDDLIAQGNTTVPPIQQNSIDKQWLFQWIISPNLSAATNLMTENQAYDKFRPQYPNYDNHITIQYGGQQAGVPTLSQVLAVGNTTGANDIAINNGQRISYGGATQPTFANGDLVTKTYADTKNIAVLDEGASRTTQATSLNFTGAGVSATATGGAVTVNIPGGGSSSGPYFFTDPTVVLVDGPTADRPYRVAFDGSAPASTPIAINIIGSGWTNLQFSTTSTLPAYFVTGDIVQVIAGDNSWRALGTLDRSVSPAEIVDITPSMSLTAATNVSVTLVRMVYTGPTAGSQITVDANQVVSYTKSWVDYTTRWSVQPSTIFTGMVVVGTAPAEQGSVIQYTQPASGLLYRFVPATYSASKDAFYSSWNSGTSTLATQIPGSVRSS